MEGQQEVMENPAAESDKRKGRSFLIENLLTNDSTRVPNEASPYYVIPDKQNSLTHRELPDYRDLTPHQFDKHLTGRTGDNGQISGIGNSSVSRFQCLASPDGNTSICSVGSSDSMNESSEKTPNTNKTKPALKQKKKTRTVFSRAQIFYLESAFDAKRYLSGAERAELASTLRLSETQVKVWFQNRRNKWKSQMSGDGKYPANQDPPHLFPGLPFAGHLSHVGFGAPMRSLSNGHVHRYPMMYL